MTEKEKDLLIKDLCARLPYGVIIQVKDWTVLDAELKIGHINRLQINDVELKPYLFPMPSMTEEQYKEYWELEHSGNMEHLSIPALDWLNKNHFDYRGLIPMGLAIDATNLNIY